MRTDREGRDTFSLLKRASKTRRQRKNYTRKNRKKESEENEVGGERRRGEGARVSTAHTFVELLLQGLQGERNY